MAEARKRNAEAPAAAAAKTQGPPQFINIVSLIVAGIAAVAVYYVQFHGSPSATSSSSQTAATSKLHLTDAELSDYSGADPSKPIYVALNGTIFDVSEGRSFYGPGGHYGHFAGRDATRAWVTTCFDPEFLTWDMKGVEKMFLPKWMDEEMEDAANGILPAEISDDMASGMKEKAAELLKKVGRLTEEEKDLRRVEDKEQVRKGIEDAIGHWVNFFRGNPKYKEVGVVVGRKPLDEGRPDIGLCEEALKKRPIKGGKFGAMMEKAAGMGMGQQQEGQKRPDFVRGGS